MTKKNFQRLAAIFIIVLVLFIHVPSIFKDIVLIIIAIGVFLSTYLSSSNIKNTENVIGE